MPTEEVESVAELIDACRLCVAEYEATSGLVGASDVITDFLTYMLNCLVPKIRRIENGAIKIATAIVAITAVVTGGATFATGAFAFAVVLKGAQLLGISPSELIARGIRWALGQTGESGLHPFVGSQHPSDGEWVKVQSTNPDAVAFSFEDNGDLLFHYNRAEPAEFVWTLMEGDTPVGSVVLPYVPGPDPVVPVLPLPAVVGLGAVLALIAARFRRRMDHA